MNDSSGSLDPEPQSVSGQSSFIAFSTEADLFGAESGLEKRTMALGDELLDSWLGDIQVVVMVFGYQHLVPPLKMTGTRKAFFDGPQFVQLEEVVENKTRSLPFEPLSHLLDKFYLRRREMRLLGHSDMHVSSQPPWKQRHSTPLLSFVDFCMRSSLVIVCLSLSPVSVRRRVSTPHYGSRKGRACKGCRKTGTGTREPTFGEDSVRDRIPQPAS